MTKDEINEIRNKMTQAMYLMQEACKANKNCDDCPLMELCNLMDRAPSRWGIKLEESSE